MTSLSLYYTRFSNRPSFVLSKEIVTSMGKSRRLENPIKETFPKELKHGEPIKIDYQVKSLVEMIGSQLRPKDRIHVEVTDSFDNVYRSNKKKYQVLVEQVNLADEINRRAK